MRSRLQISVVGGLCLVGLVQASSSAPLDAGFLTYLAEMVQDDDEWVDPLTVAEAEALGLWPGPTDADDHDEDGTTRRVEQEVAK